MSNGVTDLSVGKLSQQDRDALKAIGAVIGAVSTVWGSANVAISILKTLGAFPGSDPVTQLRQAIDQLSTEFQTFLGALSKQLTMLDVANQIETARSAHQLLYELAPDDAATPGIDPIWDAQRPTVESDSLNAVMKLGDGAYWQRPFLPQLVYSQPWAAKGILLEPPHTDLVFEYRWTLAAYLEAISIRLTVLAAVRKNLQDSKIKDEINLMVNSLEGYFITIRDTLKELPWPPSYSWEVCDIDNVSIECWQQQGAPVGAVEIYSTFNQVDTWSGELPSPSPPAPPNSDDYRKFVRRFFVRAARHWKEVFHGVGLDAVIEILVKLKVMAGVSPPVIDPPDTFYGSAYGWVHAPTGDWSLRELAQLMPFYPWSTALAVGEQFPRPRPTGLAPFSLRQMLQDLQTFSPQPYTSLRSALAQ